MPDTVIRRATVDDVPVVARHRVAMLRDMGQVPTEAMAAELLELSLPAHQAAAAPPRARPRHDRGRAGAAGGPT